MNSKPQLGLAIIGFGGMGSQHAKMLVPVEEFHLTGVYDPKADRRAYAMELGLHAYNAFEEVLADSAVDTVLIATPNHLHHDLAIAALRAHKHVICEKPAMLNAAELEDVLAAARTYNRIFVVHQTAVGMKIFVQ